MPQRRGRAAALAALLGLTAAASLDAGPPVYQVKDIKAGAGSSSPGWLQATTGAALFSTTATMLFSAGTAAFGRELWGSDGTSAGTYMVKDINPGALDSNPAALVRSSDHFSLTVFFRAEDGVHGGELWKSDGTEDGTVLVKDVNPGSAGSFPRSLTVVPRGLSSITFFIADDARTARSSGRATARRQVRSSSRT
jgi:ELWxxDGT repeat protein